MSAMCVLGSWETRVPMSSKGYMCVSRLGHLQMLLCGRKKNCYDLSGKAPTCAIKFRVLDVHNYVCIYIYVHAWHMCDLDSFGFRIVGLRVS